MYKLWQKKLISKYPESVIDIVQFGSSVLAETEPNDIDIAIIFQNIPVREQLLISQNIKEQIERKTALQIHIKPYDLYSLLDAGNFARQGIMYYGISLLSKTYFSKRFGLRPAGYIYYSLKNKQKKDKIQINYLLSGKKGKYGLLRAYGGRLLKPGLITINPEHEKIFVKAMEDSKVDYFLERTFIMDNE